MRKSKTGASGIVKKDPIPKTTSIGHGQRSRPRRRGRKRYRGQGK